MCILPRCAKTREPKDEHCVSWCTYLCYNKHNPIPLDNLKKHTHTALSYITWGLIQYIENETERSQLTNFTRLLSGISKIRERKKGSFHTNKLQISKERRKILVVKFITGTASEISKGESSNSSIRDKLKFEGSKFITSGMDKRNRIKLEVG